MLKQLHSKQDVISVYIKARKSFKSMKENKVGTLPLNKFGLPDPISILPHPAIPHIL